MTVDKKEESFEDYLSHLEKMSEKIKDRDTNLEESIQCYKEGIESYKKCKEILHRAEQTIEIYRDKEDQ